MDIQKLVDTMGDASRNTRSDYHLTLGGLIEALEKFSPDVVVVCGDVPTDHPGDAMSYRGYYSDLAFEPVNTPVTCGELLQECKRVAGETLQGYKGGDFLMGADTPLWIAEYGGSGGRAVVGISASEGRAVLAIKQIE